MRKISMYTGIVAGTAPVVGIKDGNIIRSLIMNLDGYLDDLKIGASVALDGVCMTVVSIEENHVKFDAIEETLTRTTLGNLEIGSMVNIERSLKMGDELGGHLISGHVLRTAKIVSREERGEGVDFLIENSIETRPYILQKGFIAIDGMSLTIGEITDEYFSLHIIPETLRVTTISDKKIGDKVNIEIDSRTQILVDTIRKSMEVKK